MTAEANILDKIVQTKRQEIAEARDKIPEESLRERIADAPPPRDFFAALNHPGEISLIAEVKKASPSAGIIRADFDPVSIAQCYEVNGARCISVLTDHPYFQGSLEFLTQVRSNVTVPVLRKDFILDSYQLLEARCAGADAVLLIAECLDDCELRKLHNETLALGMTPLVEFYEPDNLSRVLEAGATLVGVNNRDLKTFVTDLQHTVRMRNQIPDDVLLAGERGIHGCDDAEMLRSNGVNAMLVGEHLMRPTDIGAAVRSLLGLD